MSDNRMDFFWHNYFRPIFYLSSKIFLSCSEKKLWKMFQWKTKRNARLVCRHWNQFFEKHFPFRCHSLKLTVEPKSADVAVCPVLMLFYYKQYYQGWQFVEGFTPRGSPIMCPLKRLDGLLKRIVFADEFDGDDDLFTINFQLLCGMIKNDAVLRAVWQSKLRPVNVIIAGNRRKMRYSLKIALGILHHSGKLKSIRLKVSGCFSITLIILTLFF